MQELTEELESLITELHHMAVAQDVHHTEVAQVGHRGIGGWDRTEASVGGWVGTGLSLSW